jgi:hypothetical protein
VEEWRRSAATTSALRRVAVSGVGVFFNGERALCAGESAASMAAVRRALGHHGETTLEVLCDAVSLGSGFLDERSTASSTTPSAGYGVSPEAFVVVVVLAVAEVGVVLRVRGRSWWASAADGRGSVWS